MKTTIPLLVFCLLVLTPSLTALSKAQPSTGTSKASTSNSSPQATSTDGNMTIFSEDFEAVERVANGGFETGDFTGWTSSGPPNATVTNTAAHSGTYSLYLQGSGAVSQAFSPFFIASDLTFWAKTETASQGHVVVFISTTTVHTSWTLPITSTWTEISVPAGIGTIMEQIAISTENEAGGKYPEPKFIDDISILGVMHSIPNWNYPYDSNHDNGDDYWGASSARNHGGSYSAWCAQVGSQSQNYTIWTEDFEGAFPGLSWTVVDNNASNGLDYWNITNYRSHSGSNSAWCAGVGIQLVGVEYVPNMQLHKYDDNMWATMTRPVDLTAYSFATLSFWYWADTEPQYSTGGDALKVIYLFDGTWWMDDTKTGNSNGWQYSEVTIPNSTTVVGFGFVSDSSNHNFEGVYIDDVALVGTEEFSNVAVGHYDDNMEASLYRPVNLTGYSSATLSYWYWLDSEHTMDYLQVIYSTDAGWYYVDTHTGNSGGWQFSEANIPVNANYVGFYFSSDPSVHNYEGAYVDDVLLTAVPLPGTLMGTVIDSYTTNPIEGATVTSGGKYNFTDASGHYRIELTPGTYDVTFQKTGYYTSTVPGVTILSNTVTLQNFNPQRLPPPTLESCDITGARKDSFNGTETVYMNGSGYSPLTTYNVYIVNDTAWVDGMNIPPRVPATVLTMTLDASGDIKPVPVWFPPLTSGKYDIMVDVNNNGKYDFGIDALDDNEVQATAGFIVTSLEMRKLTISLVGLGTTDPVPSVYMFANGTEVPVSATPSPGWKLDHWALDGIDIESLNPIPVTMARDRDLTAIFVGAPPVVESCDRTGTRKDLFNTTETVYLSGNGYLPLTSYDVCVVEDVDWNDGMTIPLRVPSTVTMVTANSSGNIVQTAVWNFPLIDGRYDVCVDVNRNGRYDQGIDALDDNEIQATAGYQVVPEFTSLLLIQILFMAATLLAVGVRKRISRGSMV